MATGETAIAADEADRAFERLRNFRTIVLAVSGGPDSLALLALVAEWRDRMGRFTPAISVATVDHQLRARSDIEAQAVAEIAAQFGLPHTTLQWNGDKPATGIPDAARAARYALLDEHARTLSGGESAAIVTAHHQDDQAETIFMRLLRGGGVSALAAMPIERALARDTHVRLVRPLLTFAKSRLIASLANRGISWFDDPSNDNATFERVRVRQTLAAAQISASPLATAARRMRDADDGLRFAATSFAQSIGFLTEHAIYARCDRQAFDNGPVILRQIILDRAIAHFGGATRAPDLSELEALAQRFVNCAPFTVTLGGAVISAGSRYVRVWREPARITAAAATLRSGPAVPWDGRFMVGFEGRGVAITVKPLGPSHQDHSGALGLRTALKDVPRAAFAGLPAFYAGEALIGVPILTNSQGRQTLTGGGEIWSEPIPMPAF